MYFMKRLLFCFITLWLVVSLYKDLTEGTSPFNDSKLNHVEQTYSKDLENKSSVQAVRVRPGDTILSITEQINDPLAGLDIKQIIIDFKNVNPRTDPYQLETDAVYYFNKY